jgi:hypothetical protein
MGQDPSIVFDALSLISPTGINEIKGLFILLIQLRLPIFAISPLNIQLFKGEVTSASTLQRASLIATFQACLPNSSRPVMKIKIILSGN